jgi:hypothetical protein
MQKQRRWFKQFYTPTASSKREKEIEDIIE